LDRTLIAPRSAHSTGIELSATDPVGEHWIFSGSYTLARTTDDLGGRDVPRSWDQTHALNGAVTWRRPASSASLTLSWHSGWPRTPIDRVPATATQPSDLQIGPRNAARWADYLAVDVRITHTFELPLGELDLRADATNLLNRGNPCCSTYDRLDTTGMLLAPATTSWFPRVLNVGIQWRVRSRP
jgi:hypothetical protein